MLAVDLAQVREAGLCAVGDRRGDLRVRVGLRARVDQRATERGDTSGIRKAEEALEARRSWLTEAERTLAEFSG